MRMFKKIFLTILLVIFSFYYTNKVLDFIKSKDQIMIEIKKNKDNYKINAIDAIIENNTIIPGKCGLVVDVNLSYLKMKKLNYYSDSLLVFKKIPPSISLKNQFDKLILSGNSNKKQISILLKISDINIINKINNQSINIILETKFINKNQEYLKTISNDIVVFEEKNPSSLAKFCYAEKKYHGFCKDSNLYTINPFYISHNYYYNTYIHLENGRMFSYQIKTEKELQEISILIQGIKNLGYEIVSLSTLLEE